MLLQIYRETKVSLINLLPNEVALRVIAASLSARSGTTYQESDVRAEFERLAESTILPKLPNDIPYVPRNHVTSEGKRYERKILRVRPRRKADATGDAQLWSAM